MKLLKSFKKKIDKLRGKSRELSKDEIKEAFLNPVSSKKFFTIFHDVNIIFTILILTIAILSDSFFILIILILLDALLIFRLYIYQEKQLKNYEISYEDDLDPLIFAFKNYLGKKGRRKDNKKIEFLIQRIEKADIHFRYFKRFYRISYFIWILIVYIVLISFLFSRINVFSINSDQIEFMFYLIITFTIFLTIFMIRNYHFKNLKRAKYLFELIFSKNLNKIFSELEKIAFYEKKYEFYEKILELLKEWHKLYHGIYPIEDSENEQLIYENRQSTVKVQELNKFYNLFNSLRINISVELISLEGEDNFKQKLKTMEHLTSFLNNYIELINFKI